MRAVPVGHDISSYVNIYVSMSGSVSCAGLDEVIEDIKQGLEKPDPLRSVRFIKDAYFEIEIEEFTYEDRARIAYEYYRMKKSGKWYGRADLGRWEVYILDKDKTLDVTRVILVILDRKPMMSTWPR